MTDDDDLKAETQEPRSTIGSLQHRRVTRIEVLNSETSFERTHTEYQPGSDPGLTWTLMPTAPSEEQSSDHTFTKDSFDVGGEYKMDDRRNWDRDIGAKWLGRVGSVAFVLGIVFFCVATEAGILDPPGRIAAGTTGRTTLLAGGQRIARRQGHKR